MKELPNTFLDKIKTWFPNFTPDFPLNLQLDLYDIGILGAEIDRPVMKTLQQLFRKFIKKANGEPVDVVTIDLNSAHTSRYVRLEEILKRATLYFLFISDAFLECSWASFVKTEAIEKVLEDKRTSVVPVCPDGKPRDVFGLNGIRGINIMDLLNGKTILEVNIEKINKADMNQDILSGIEKTVRKYSYVKTKRHVELREQRNIFKEKEKMSIIRRTMDTRPEPPPTYEARVRNLPVRTDGTLEVSMDSGMKLPVKSVKMRSGPVVVASGDPIIDFSKQRLSDSSESSFEELWLTEFEDG